MLEQKKNVELILKELLVSNKVEVIKYIANLKIFVLKIVNLLKIAYAGIIVGLLHELLCPNYCGKNNVQVKVALPTIIESHASITVLRNNLNLNH